MARDVTEVVLVDDHAIVRRGLRQILDTEPDFHVCAEAATESEAFDLVETLAPGLLVTDLTLEGRSGLDLVKRVHRYHPGVPILVVSMHEAELYADRALAAGARGYVMKRRSEEEVVRAARAVRDGQTYVGGGTVSGAAEPLPSDGPLAALTDREMEVFFLMGQGYSPRHVADQLSLSVSTVEVYRERIKEKLNVASSPLLLRYAIQWCKDNQAP